VTGTWLEALSWLTAASAVLLVAAYGIGAPFFLLRTLLTLGKRRRLRYRTRNDDILATSRFTIPVSLIVPLDADVDDAPHRVRHLLQLRYPELELIVVVSAGPALDDLKHALSLSAAEVFYRKSLAGAAVRGLYRSDTDARVIVVQSEPASVGEALNCGVNLARYRYLVVADAPATYSSDALLESMQAALEEPQRVVGATTSLSVLPVEGLDAALRGEAPTGLVAALQYLAAARTRLVTIGRRRLDLPPDGCPGFTIWRRDVVLDVGGFAEDVTAIHADMTLRMHAHFGANRQRYRIIHVTEPVGLVVPADAQRLARRARVSFAMMWRHRALLLNPRYGRLGLIDLPRYALNLLVAPWVELLALVLLGLAVPLGVLKAGHLLLVLVTIGLGNGILTASALLLTGLSGHDPRPSALFNLLLVGPFEYFFSRPALLIERYRRS
jgi:cellulose synthase/poly-beta-1,6-N-acetylglucosamine synthase-like glycosyltransferase